MQNYLMQENSSSTAFIFMFDTVMLGYLCLKSLLQTHKSFPTYFVLLNQKKSPVYFLILLSTHFILTPFLTLVFNVCRETE